MKEICLYLVGLYHSRKVLCSLYISEVNYKTILFSECPGGHKSHYPIACGSKDVEKFFKYYVSYS